MYSKNTGLEIKALEADGTVRAYIATYRSTPDADGDVIEPGAFTKSLASQPRIPMLWQHDTKAPCGHWFAYDLKDLTAYSQPANSTSLLSGAATRMAPSRARTWTHAPSATSPKPPTMTEPVSATFRH